MKFWAFVSYSRADDRWAAWLHKALETYRVPARLVGTETDGEKIPERLFPIFRDRDELRASADLGTNLNHALLESRNLIVICSPNAARSRWVGEEIKEFKRTGREERIFALIVGGEPNASDGVPGYGPEDECFPAALRYRLGADGELSGERTEPIAADLREDRDGRNNAKLKLLAGLLRVEFDALKRRDEERRARRVKIFASISFVLVAIFATLALLAVLSAREAARRKVEAQRLLVASDMMRAQELFERNEAPGALAYLARATAMDPDPRSVAAERLWFALTQRAWPLPVSAPMHHRDAVTTACFSPDGRRVVTASKDKTARLWNALTGEQEGEPLEHSSSVGGARFTADRSLVVTICDDAAARLWDAHSGALVREWPKLPDKIVAVSLSSKGTFLATSSKDGTLRVSRALTGEIVWEKLHRENVHILAFHPADDALLVSVSGDVATLWNASDGRTLLRIEHAAEIKSACFNPTGDRILTASGDGIVRITDVATGVVASPELTYHESVTKAIFGLTGDSVAVAAGRQVYLTRATGEPLLAQPLEFEQAVNALCFSPDGLILYAGSDDGKVQAWRILTGERIGEPIREEGPISALENSPDGQQLLVATSDAGSTRVWRPAPRGPLADRFTHGEDIGLLSVSPLGDLLVTASKKGTARLWNLREGKAQAEPLVHRDEIVCAAFSPDGKYLLTGSADETARLWFASSGKPVADALVHHSTVSKVAFNPKGGIFATATEKGVAQFWEINSLQPIGKEMVHDGRIVSIDFNAGGERFLTAGTDGKVHVWKSGTGEPLGDSLENPNDFTCARFSPAGDIIATGTSFDKTAQLWSSATRRPLSKPLLHDSAVTDLVFSPNGKLLATAAGGTAEIWRVDGNLVGDPLRHAGEVTAVAFTPDSTRLATASGDGTARVWDAATGFPITEWLRHRADVRCIAFSPDGKTLFCAGRNGTVRLWDIANGLTPADHLPLAAFARILSPTALKGTRLTTHLIPPINLLRDQANGSSIALHHLLDWALSDPAQRTVTPFSRATLPSYLAARRTEGTADSLAEAAFYASGNKALPLPPNDTLSVKDVPP